jgi:hypothetical protein
MAVDAVSELLSRGEFLASGEKYRDLSQFGLTTAVEVFIPL